MVVIHTSEECLFALIATCKLNFIVKTAKKEIVDNPSAFYAKHSAIQAKAWVADFFVPLRL
jgi:hypothetical protein